MMTESYLVISISPEDRDYLFDRVQQGGIVQEGDGPLELLQKAEGLAATIVHDWCLRQRELARLMAEHEARKANKRRKND